MRIPLPSVARLVFPMTVAALVFTVAPTAWALDCFIPDDSNSWAFPADCPDPTAASPIDLRRLNETVAGQHGPLRLSRDGNRLEYADGKPFVAWVVHLPHGYDGKFTKDTWTAADYQRSARFLARLGVNVGIIGAVNPAIGSADADTVAANVLDYTFHAVAAAKDAGIYTQLRLAWPGSIPGAQFGIADSANAACLLQFHPRVQAAWKAWAKQLLTTVNPYTKVALKDEPALFSLEIANEDSLLFYVTDHIAGEARAELERQFCAFCVKKYGSTDKALAAWNHAADKADRPADGRLGLMIMWMLTRDGQRQGHPDPQRTRDQLAFLVAVSESWNREARRYVQEELGAKHLLVAASNFVPADRVVLDDALRLLAWRDMDIIENNDYFTDNGKGGPDAGWRIDYGYTMGLHSAVMDPLGLPTNKRQVEGKPFFCTEILWPRPQPFEVEGPLLVAAYQAMNGLGGLAWAGPRDITWERPQKAFFPWWNVHGSVPLAPFCCAGPATLGQFPAAALIARLGLVKAAPTVVREMRTADQIGHLEEPRISEEFADDPNEFARGQIQDTAISGGIPKEAFLVGRVSVQLAASATAAQVADLRPYIKDGKVTSATGELVMDTARKLFTTDAPAAQVAVGFLKDAGEIKLSEATITCDLEHGTIAVVAIDAQPITQSHQILVQIGARSVPTGWQESPATIDGKGGKRDGLRIDATGALPWRVHQAAGTVLLPHALVTKGTVLDGNGIPSGPAQVVVDHGAVTLTLPATASYVVLE